MTLWKVFQEVKQNYVVLGVDWYVFMVAEMKSVVKISDTLLQNAW
jgi:hypothetical protein